MVGWQEQSPSLQQVPVKAPKRDREVVGCRRRPRGGVTRVSGADAPHGASWMATAGGFVSLSFPLCWGAQHLEAGAGSAWVSPQHLAFSLIVDRVLFVGL